MDENAITLEDIYEIVARIEDCTFALSQTLELLLREIADKEGNG